MLLKSTENIFYPKHPNIKTEAYVDSGLSEFTIQLQNYLRLWSSQQVRKDRKRETAGKGGGMVRRQREEGETV